MARWKALWLLAKMARVRVPKRLNPPRPRSFCEIYTRIFFKLRETVQKEPRRRRQRRRSFNLYPVETQELFDSSMFEMSRKEERGRERGREREREKRDGASRILLSFVFTCLRVLVLLLLCGKYICTNFFVLIETNAQVRRI